jgi:hypothetical protein
MSPHVLRFTANDCGALVSRCHVAWDAPSALAALKRANSRFRLAVVDSVQELDDASELAAFHTWKKSGGCLVLISQLNQQDRAAGRRSLEHDADAVLAVEPADTPGLARVTPEKSRLTLGRRADFFLGRKQS